MTSCLPAGARGEFPQGAPGGPEFVYVLDRFPVLSQTFVANEVRELRSLGHRVTVVTARPPLRIWRAGDDLSGTGTRLRRGLVAAHLAGLRRSRRRYLAYLRVLVTSSFGDAAYLLWAPVAAAALAEETAQHVHTHFAFRASSFARGLCALLGLTRSVTTHANDLFVHEGLLGRRLDGAGVLTISDFNRRFLSERDIRAEVAHCGVDSDALRRVKETTESPASHERVDVLFVGRMVPKKGPTVLVEALAKLRGDAGMSPRVLMVGEGPLLEQSRRLADRLGVPVEFTGALSSEQTVAELSRARCLCLPAVRDPEGDQDGIPVVLMEAMALGTPVVTTSVSGIPELVTSDVGWIVEAESNELPVLIAEALQHCLGDPAEAKRRADRARVIIDKEFTLRSQAEAVASMALRAQARSS